ncbi:MAG: hypothetical protein U9Q76_04940, partial [candidate division WOR-3 bacterium]|nr:hypothetical protein [candidate division WOR-3 bacterium]
PQSWGYAMSHADWPRNTRTPTGHFHYYSELALRSQGHNTRNTPLEIRVNILTRNDMEIVL